MSRTERPSALASVLSAPRKPLAGRWRRLEDEDRGARRLPCLEGRLQGGAGGVAGEEQAPLDLAEGEAFLPQKRSDDRIDAAADPLRHLGRVDRFDETVDDGQAQGPSIPERLLGEDDAGQDVARLRIGGFERAGRIEDGGGRHALAGQAGDHRPRCGLQRGQPACDRYTSDRHHQAVGSRRRLEARSAEEFHRAATTRWRRSKGRRSDLARRLRGCGLETGIGDQGDGSQAGRSQDPERYDALATLPTVVTLQRSRALHGTLIALSARVAESVAEEGMLSTDR